MGSRSQQIYALRAQGSERTDDAESLELINIEVLADDPPYQRVDLRRSEQGDVQVGTEKEEVAEDGCEGTSVALR